MQKIARRVATAERVAAKRQKIKSTKYHKKWKTQDLRARRQRTNRALQEVQNAKQVIRDDWAMGPIAPRTDYGEWHDALGAVGEDRFASNGRLSLTVRNARCQWAGGAYNLNLAKGDRVVLLDGPDKGRIGNIMRIDHDSAEVTIKNLNKSNVRISEYLRNTQTDPAAANLELPLPISAIRLVHPITDPTTGKTKDVIINQLVSSGLVSDRITGTRRWDRIVPGLNISIPWPVKEEPERPEHKIDTQRIDVEEKTFIPTLLRPPMPEAIIDELRGKYSRFRMRHDPEYIARLEEKEKEKEGRAKLMDSMRTPLQEFHREERKNKKKKGKPRLTLEMLEKIGEVIAKNRERSLNAAGVSDAQSQPPPPPPPVTTTIAIDAEPSAPPPPST